ncbi:MAG: nuclear transport factor 2 family protein [Acidimicrobiales bacterium]|nr:nuclear transport factor 2 family protein [Acidimicrobiales bacterium]
MNSEDLVEIEHIRQLKARYFRLMDQKRWNEWGDVFTEDVSIDTPIDTPGEGPVVGRDNMVAYLAPILEGVITCHHGHMSEITLTGPDTAEAVWSMEDHLDWPPESGMGKMWGTGWYEERYRKCDDGRWRIASLVLHRIRIEVDGNRVYPPAGMNPYPIGTPG